MEESEIFEVRENVFVLKRDYEEINIDSPEAEKEGIKLKKQRYIFFLDLQLLKSIH